jgi:hypothetical protein
MIKAIDVEVLNSNKFLCSDIAIQFKTVGKRMIFDTVLALAASIYC